MANRGASGEDAVRRLVDKLRPGSRFVVTFDEDPGYAHKRVYGILPTQSVFGILPAHDHKCLWRIAHDHMCLWRIALMFTIGDIRPQPSTL